MAGISALDYLNRALTTIQKCGLMTKSIDWKELKQKCMEMASAGKKPSDTYAAINYALSQLTDKHSFLGDPRGRTVPNSHIGRPAQKSLRRRIDSQDQLIASNGTNIGLIIVRSIGAANNSAESLRYVMDLRKQIDNLIRRKAAGWIIDVRGNGGGNMWPMLAGVGAIAGSGTLGFFKYDTVSIPWFYERGSVGFENSKGKHIHISVADGMHELSQHPVAVLIDNVTASSGEAVSISFKSRERARFFGEATRGLSTSTEPIRLVDGAKIYLATSIMADRNGNAFFSGVAPDEWIEQDETIGGEDDRVIVKATSWLISTIAE